MKALIFAAGLGTRLRPLTDSMPKALVSLAGEALLGRLIRKLVKAGVDEVVVNVHHFPDMIIDYLMANDFNVPVTVSDERDLLRETGGGIQYAGPLLLRTKTGQGVSIIPASGKSATLPSMDRSCRDSSRFIVHNVDILSNLDIPLFLSAAALRFEALSTLVVSERETSRYFLFDDDMRLVGWENALTGELRSPYPGLDATACHRLAFGGIHCVSNSIFDAFRKEHFSGCFSIVDFYISVCHKYPIYGYIPRDFRLLDVGKPEALQAAKDYLLLTSSYNS